ncbi:hypothetical protein [Pedococcus sp. 5OH_020]|uniref:hypothetical protein n=1 Tax=Pedococcus sp. 5OH_020 TaxID=2989814 RepID=UPI0022E9A2CD|nr:hypothetical protein [Pedococcus sp. 5OH_020]
MAKLSFLAGVAAGYVLGAKAGQKRYEQIKSRAGQVWSSEPVQTRVGSVKEAVKEQAPVVASKLGSVAKTAGSSAKDRLTGEDLPQTLHRGTDGHLHADTSGFGPGADKLP